MKYRKKPVVIEAWHWTQSHAQDPAPDWMNDASHKWPADGSVAFQPDHPDGSRIAIITMEGVMSALPGDWIVRGIKGELYPVKPDVFEATYEPAE